MKLDRITLAKASYVAALSGIHETIDAKRHGVEVTLERNGYVSVIRGEKVSLVRDWAVADLAEEQDDAVEGDSTAGVAAAAPRRRGRPPKNPAPIPT